MAIKNEIPKRVCLLEVGDNDSSKGQCIYKSEMAEELNKLFSKRNKNKNKYRFDLDHAAFNPEAVDKSSYGRYDLIADETGVWADNIEWTEDAEELISKGKYEAFSVAVELNEDMSLKNLFNVALTNLPADDTASLWKEPMLRSVTTKNIALLRTQSLIKKEQLIMNEDKVNEVVEPDDKEPIVQREMDEDEDETCLAEGEVSQPQMSVEEMAAEIETLKADKAGLQAMVDELTAELQKYQETARQVAEDTEMAEKKKLLANRSKSVADYLINKPLVEVRDYCKKFTLRTSAPVVAPVVVESETGNVEDVAAVQHVQKLLSMGSKSRIGYSWVK